MKFKKKFIAIFLAGIVMLLYLNISVHTSAQTIENSIGYLDNPVSGTTLKGTENISGWFLDTSGVANIEVLVDNVLVGQAVYGDARPDVQKSYPQFNNGNPGFHYALDTTRFADGQYTVTVRGTGKNGHVTTVANSTVTIENTRGYADNPVSGAKLTGTHTVSGWFLNASGVQKIEVLVDDTVVGQATYGDARPDVLKTYPQFNNGSAGYHYVLDTTKFTDGQHTVTIRGTGKNGHVNTLASSTVTIENTSGYVDTPVSGTNLTGTQSVSGWFLDASGVASIEVLVDDVVVGQAAYGDVRPDVKQAFPQFNNGNAGFHYTLDTTQFTDGQHTVSIREIGKNGHINTLTKNTITIENTKWYLDKPVSGTTLRGTDILSGWFLDSKGVANIEVLVDGKVVGQAVYGDVRPDVEKANPQFKNGNAGFHYALDTTKFTDGTHTVTIRVTGNNGHVTTLPDSTIKIENALGSLDNPLPGTTLSGTNNINGWFLDGSGVASIEILVDGTVVGQAIYGDARPDVKQTFPQFNNGNAGFHYTLDTTIFSDGPHTVSIRVTGKNGRVTTFPDNPIKIENALGSLDNPLPGATIKGTQNIYGWFLDASGVANIDVLVDGTVVGQAIYGDARPDVKKSFPQFNNGNAGFHYTLDTTKYSNGPHTVTIRVTGKNGRVLTLPTSTVTFMQSRTVFLDPGHGGSDPGAVAGGYREADLNLTVAKKVQSLLLDRGYTVYMSRNNNTNISLLDRSIMANSLKPDIFVSIHHNSTGVGATTADGIESYYYKYYVDYPSKINEDMHNNPERILKSVTLTNLIHENMVDYTGADDRGTAGDTFSVVREAAMPATLLELGFINNASERQKLVTDSYQNKLAKAIADGIDEYFRIY